MSRKKKISSVIFWVLLFLVIIAFPEFSPVIGLVAIGVFWAKKMGSFLDSHL